MWSRSARISAADGGSLVRNSSASAPEPILNERTSRTPVGDGAEDDLRRAAADVDDPDVALDRVAERLGRADEGEPALLLLAEDLDLEPGRLARSASRPRSAFFASRIAAVATIRIASAPSSSASRTWVATTSATSAIFSSVILPLRFESLPIRV